MTARFPSRRLALFARRLLVFSLCSLAAGVLEPKLAAAQTGATPLPAAAPAAGSSADAAALIGKGRIVLVFPFDNATPPSASGAEQSTLDWVGEAAPQVLNSRFTSAGFLPLSREDRLYALDHLGFPETFSPSRATALRVAETLDADYILIGSYSVIGSTLTLKSRIVEVSKLKLSDEVTETGQFAQLIPLLNSLAWKLTHRLDPKFSVPEETFRAAGSKLRLDAFEQFVRGITEKDPNERLRHLNKATDLSPDFTDAWFATGRLQFASQQFDQAAVSFGKVKGDDSTALEAGFYRGLSLMFSGSYAKAEDSFATVARVLPLAEVVNNQAVAVSRRGHDSVALFRQAEASDPTDPDYHFNLAVSLHRHGDRAAAIAEIDQSLKLRPGDSEAKTAEQAWKSAPDKPQPKPADASQPASLDAKPATAESTGDPLERLKRTYNGAAFRQASVMINQMKSETPAKR